MNVNYVVGEDWQGLYVEGKLVIEEHTLKLMEVLEVISREWKNTYKKFSITKWEVDQDWLEDTGSLPENVEEIQKDMIEFIEEISF